MDLWSVHVKNTNLLLRNEKHFVSGHLKSVRVENWKVFEIRVPKRQAFSGSGYHSLLVKAMGKKNSDNSNSSSSSGKGPEEDNLKGSDPSSENDSSKKYRCSEISSEALGLEGIPSISLHSGAAGGKCSL